MIELLMFIFLYLLTGFVTALLYEKFLSNENARDRAWVQMVCVVFGFASLVVFLFAFFVHVVYDFFYSRAQKILKLKFHNRS